MLLDVRRQRAPGVQALDSFSVQSIRHDALRQGLLQRQVVVHVASQHPGSGQVHEPVHDHLTGAVESPANMPSPGEPWVEDATTPATAL